MGLKTRWIDQNILLDLSDLQSDGGEEDFLCEVIDSFLVSSEKTVEYLVECARIADSRSIGHHAHSLKSSAFSLGAIEVGELCQDLEDLSDQHNPDSSRRTVLLLMNALERASADLRNLKADRLQNLQQKSKRPIQP
jgi:HPt (histidine-containing phosphotransfer) domain-containing protein